MKIWNFKSKILKRGDKRCHYVGKINGFAKWVQKNLNRFNVVGTDGKDSFWPIPMKKGFDRRCVFQGKCSIFWGYACF